MQQSRQGLHPVDSKHAAGIRFRLYSTQNAEGLNRSRYRMEVCTAVVHAVTAVQLSAQQRLLWVCTGCVLVTTDLQEHVS
jgi:hypothetical protein